MTFGDLITNIDKEQQVQIDVFWGVDEVEVAAVEGILEDIPFGDIVDYWYNDVVSIEDRNGVKIITVEG